MFLMQNQGVIPNTAKLSPAFSKLAEKGREVTKTTFPQERIVWEQTQAAQQAIHVLRSLNAFSELHDALQKLISQYPKCTQRVACERLLRVVNNTQRIHEEAQRKAEIERRLIEADSQKLATALAEARAETGNYRRKEMLLRLRSLYPKATNHAELEAALTLCEANIEREESAVRNALKLLETVENPKLGIIQADKILREMDPISPLVGSVQSVRADFIERQQKSDRNRHILYAVIGVVILLLVYFLFDLLNGIWRAKQRT